MQNSAHIAGLLVTMAENTDTELSEARLDLIMAALAKHDDQAIEEALARHTRHSRWFPRVSEILDLIEGTPEDAVRLEAEKQWGHLWVAVDKGAWTTYYGEELPGPAHYLSPLARLVLAQMGGREAMLAWKRKDLDWKWKDWLDHFRTLYGQEHLLLEAQDRKQIPADVKKLVEGIGREVK